MGKLVLTILLITMLTVSQSHNQHTLNLHSRHFETEPHSTGGKKGVIMTVLSTVKSIAKTVVTAVGAWVAVKSVVKDKEQPDTKMERKLMKQKH